MMDSLFRLKDTIVGLITPSPKRQRTAAESTSTAPDEEHFFVPRPPINNNVQVDVQHQGWSPSARLNPLKRRRSDDSEERETVLPEDSISQVMASIEVDSVVMSYDRKIKVEYISGESELAVSGANDEEEDVVMGSGSEEEEEAEVAYDSDGSEIEVESASEAEVEYDSDGNEIEVEAEVEYDSDGNEIEPKSEAEIEYDSDGNEIEVEEVDSEVELDSDGNEVEYEVEEREEEEEEEEGSDSDVEIKEEEFEESPEPDPEQVAAEKEQERLAREADLVARLEDIENARLEGGWHPDELYLYERLAMRGFEPLLPLEWKIDFPSIPYYLFIDHNVQQPLIGFNYSSHYHGVRVLQPLISAGSMVAFDESINAPDDTSERRMYRVIFQFNRWAEKDGDYWKRRILPVLTLIRKKPGQSTDRILKNITNQMTFLAKRHREYLGAVENEDGSVKLDPNRRTPPLLYGILIMSRLVIVVTLDSADPKASIKTMRDFNLAEGTQSVWNGLGIAMVVMVARNYLLAIKDEFEIDDTPEQDDDL